MGTMLEPQHFRLISVVLLSYFVTPSISQKLEWESPWTHVCVLDTMDGPACQRSPFNATSDGPDDRIPLSVCILTCGDYGPLWPYPNGVIRLGSTLTAFKLPRFRLVSAVVPHSIEYLVEKSFKNAYNIIEQMLPPEASLSNVGDNVVEVAIHIEEPVEKFQIGVNEAYSLTINRTVANDAVIVNVHIAANTYFGARHGLETLSQLIAFNGEIGAMQIVDSVEIEDRPTFQYRGLLIDTARNFFPTEYLRKLIDGLSQNKMNILHWHLTDSNSFPFVSKRMPQVTRYGIFDPSKVYTEDDITSLIEYANERGVKIIPELDAPSHAGNGWQWGSLEGLGELSLCVNAQPYKSYCIQPPCGQLNPLNNNTYFVLGELYKDLLDVFDRDIFHMGNDEISYKCWLSDKGVQDWLTSNSVDLIELWGIFQQQAFSKLTEANNGTIKAMVWTSEMTNYARKFLDPQDYIIQLWSYGNDSVIGDIIREKYQVVFSNNDTLYLDHGYGAWRGTQNKATLKSWQQIYGHDILSIVERHIGTEETEQAFQDGQILGGEATLWSEKVDPQNMEMKMWPRGAALGERLWSNPPSNRTRFAYPRLIHHRQRMVERGIHADTLLPEVCYNIWGFCDDPDDPPPS